MLFHVVPPTFNNHAHTHHNRITDASAENALKLFALRFRFSRTQAFKTKKLVSFETTQTYKDTVKLDIHSDMSGTDTFS